MSLSDFFIYFYVALDDRNIVDEHFLCIGVYGTSGNSNNCINSNGA